MDGQNAGGYAIAAKVEASRYGVTHTWVGGAIAADAAGDNGQNSIGLGPWITRYRMLSASLQLTHWSGRGSWGIQIQDDWVSEALGVDVLFAGAAWRTDLTGFLWNHPWIRIGATPQPWLVPDEYEGGVGSPESDFPHMVSRESPLAYRQNCLPGVGVVEDTVLVAAPVYRLDDSLFALHGSWEYDGAPRDGYVSVRSLVYSAFYEVGAAMVPAAGHPEIVLMKFLNEPVTPVERETWWEFSVFAAPDVRYVRRVRGSRDGVAMIVPPGETVPVPNPDGYPTVDSRAKGWDSATRVTLAHLPTWFSPGTVAERSSIIRQAIGTWAMGTDPVGYIPLIDSAQPLPAAFGAVYTTVIGDEVEYAFAVKSLDNSLVAVDETRRLIDDQPEAPTEAAIMVAKTGLVFLRAPAANPSMFSVRSDFHDVIGPADCAQYGAGMDPTVAFLPQVRYACTLGEQRAYAVRAVRFDRTPFLAALLSQLGVNVPMPYTASYEGRENSSVGGPVFYTDREFGPYPDRSKYEELWFVVDGVKYVVDTRALGGNIEPITEAKYGNAVLDPMRWFGSTISSHQRQMLGMFSEEDQTDFELLDFYSEEYVAPGSEMNTFAQVSETDIMFVLSHRRFVSASRYFDAVVCRFSATTGQAHVVAVVPDDGNQQIGEFLALTCYQFETKNEEGTVTREPGLILRRGRENIGQVLTSVDGGVTWELLYDATSTALVNSSGTYSQNGTPSMGLHIVGPVGDPSADPHYILQASASEEP